VDIRPEKYSGAGQPAGQKLATPTASVKAAVPGLFPCIGKAEADVVVAIAGCVVVAIRYTAVLRVVVPRPAAYDAVGAFGRLPLFVMPNSVRRVFTAMHGASHRDRGSTKA
jgi:hypothetical protein